MDLKTRKLNIIEYLINLQDEQLFTKIEALIQDNKDIKPFTKKEFLERVRESNEDYTAGRVISQEELESQSQNW